jgi:hypothetical protein
MPRGDHHWKPGQSGNPAGRPKKGKTLTDILEKHGRKRDVLYKDPATGEQRYMSRKEALAKELWMLALKGDVQAIKYIYDRIDGKPEQAIDMNAQVQGDLMYVLAGADSDTSEE